MKEPLSIISNETLPLVRASWDLANQQNKRCTGAFQQHSY